MDGIELQAKKYENLYNIIIATISDIGDKCTDAISMLVDAKDTLLSGDYKKALEMFNEGCKIWDTNKGYQE